MYLCGAARQKRSDGGGVLGILSESLGRTLVLPPKKNRIHEPALNSSITWYSRRDLYIAEHAILL